MSDGEWVHVYSRFRWFQTKWVPRQTITEEQDASMHHNESSTEDPPLPETTRLEEKEERLTDSSAREAGILDLESPGVTDNKEFLGPFLMWEETDAPESDIEEEDIEERQTCEEPWQWELVMAPGKARVQEPLEEPPPEKSEARRACEGRNKIPTNVSYESRLRTSKEIQNVECEMRRYQ